MTVVYGIVVAVVAGILLMCFKRFFLGRAKISVHELEKGHMHRARITETERFWGLTVVLEITLRGAEDSQIEAFWDGTKHDTILLSRQDGGLECGTTIVKGRRMDAVLVFKIPKKRMEGMREKEDLSGKLSIQGTNWLRWSDTISIPIEHGS